MQISCSTGAFVGYPLPYSLKLLQDAGFESIELMATHEVRKRGAKQIQELAARRNIQITSVHPSIFRSLTYTPESYRDNHLRSAELALALPDCTILVWHVPSMTGPETTPEEKRLRVLEEAVDMVKGTKVRIALENKAFNAPPQIDTDRARLHFQRILELGERMDRFAGQSTMTTTLDTTHTGTMALNLLDCYDIWRGRVGNIHLSDMDGHTRSKRPGLNRELTQHRLVGTGVLPLMEFIDELVASRFDGLLTFELHPLALHWWNPFGIVPLLRQQLNMVRGRVAQAEAATLAGASSV